MSKISELRSKAANNAKAMQEVKVERIKAAVSEVVSSDAFTLTALNHIGSGSTDNSDVRMQEFATQVAAHVAEVITDPKNEFIDACKSRGLDDRRVTKAVHAVNELFNLTTSTDYSEKLEAVALYLQRNPHLYEDIAPLT